MKFNQIDEQMKQNQAKLLFPLPGECKHSTPMSLTDYYQWLKENASDNVLTDHKAYLEHIGFDREIHRLSDRDSKLLRSINHHYYYQKYHKAAGERNQQRARA